VVGSHLWVFWGFLFFFSFLVVLVYTSCVRRGALRFLLIYLLLTYQKKNSKNSHLARISCGGAPAMRFESSLGLPLVSSVRTSACVPSRPEGEEPGITSCLKGSALAASKQNSIH
jgi:hypothetical protein